jgi:broad specificity phosphatase PhoE
VQLAILVRHGESDYSVRGAMNGDPRTTVALTERGRDEARALGELLADEAIDLCVTTEFGRTAETADLVLAGRDVPRLVLAELNEIRVGEFEGRLFPEYRGWASTHDPLAAPPGGGESRAETARRYVRGFRTLLARPEPTILVVTHGLPIRYILNAARGVAPTPVLDAVEHATAYRYPAAELERAVDLLDEWCAAPAWPT